VSERLPLFSESCETTLRTASVVGEETSESLKDQLIHLFDELLEDAKKELKATSNERLGERIREWLDVTENFVPFRVGVNVLYHLADLHKTKGGTNVNSLIRFLSGLQDVNKLKDFVVNQADDMIKKGADEVMRHIVSTEQVRRIAQELFEQ
jgi:hypothetical protein